MRTDWPSVVLFTLGIVVLAIYPRSAPSQPAASQVSPINPPVADCNTNKFTGPESGFLSRALPCAPNFASPFVDSKGVSHAFDIDGLQHNFDFYSWETFVALNWPNGGGTAIGKGPRPGGDAQPAWEDVKNFRQLPDVMLEDGAKPSWGTRIVPAECQSMDGPGKMVIHVIEEAFDQPFKSGPLIDQNGNYALFDILINKPMFDYIVENSLYSRRGQEQFVAGRDGGPSDVVSTSPGAPESPPARIINFPKGSQPPKDGQGTMGAVMLKISWKVLGNGDDPTKFHTVNGLVFTRGGEGTPGRCVPRTLGMIGFHVAHKTASDPQWLWTTFEHVANAPEDADVAANKIDPNAHFNFYNPRCPPSACPANALPPQPWAQQVEPFPNGFRSQITRAFQIMDGAKILNEQFHNLDGIKGSVWQNYMLVSTQWPTDASNKINPTGVPAPTYLANTTLETYSQGDTPLSSSSCIGCHNNATTLHLPAGASDFTFTLEKAR
jgi:hypothetical protein